MATKRVALHSRINGLLGKIWQNHWFWTHAVFMCILYIYRSLYMICSKVIMNYTVSFFKFHNALVTPAPLISTILWPQKPLFPSLSGETLRKKRFKVPSLTCRISILHQFEPCAHAFDWQVGVSAPEFFFYTDQWMMLPRCWIEFDFKFWDPKFHENRSSRRQQYPQQKDDALKLWERTEEASRARMHPDVRHGVLLNFSDGQGRCNW